MNISPKLAILRTYICSDIANIIAEYASQLKLLSWINNDLYSYNYGYENPAAIEFHKIYNNRLSKNSVIFELIF